MVGLANRSPGKAPQRRGAIACCLWIAWMLSLTDPGAMASESATRATDLADENGAFSLVETSIAAIHRAMVAGELTASELVQGYLERVEMYDKRGPALNALVTLNPAALERAEELDLAFRQNAVKRPLGFSLSANEQTRVLRVDHECPVRMLLAHGEDQSIAVHVPGIEGVRFGLRSICPAPHRSRCGDDEFRSVRVQPRDNVEDYFL